MRVFISFEGSGEPFDVAPDLTVGAMKQMVKVIKLTVTSLLMELHFLLSFDYILEIHLIMWMFYWREMD